MNTASPISIIALVLGGTALSYSTPNRPEIFFCCLGLAILISIAYAYLELKWLHEDKKILEQLSKDMSKVQEDIKILRLFQRDNNQ